VADGRLRRQLFAGSTEAAAQRRGFAFPGTNTLPASTLIGLNTLLLSASICRVPDIVALAATPSDDGIANIVRLLGTGLFAMSTANVGATGTITAAVDTGSARRISLLP